VAAIGSLVTSVGDAVENSDGRTSEVRQALTTFNETVSNLQTILKAIKKNFE